MKSTDLEMYLDSSLKKSSGGSPGDEEGIKHGAQCSVRAWDVTPHLNTVKTIGFAI
jgi:hypothetical protein